MYPGITSGAEATAHLTDSRGIGGRNATPAGVVYNNNGVLCSSVWKYLDVSAEEVKAMVSSGRPWLTRPHKVMQTKLA